MLKFGLIRAFVICHSYEVWLSHSSLSFVLRHLFCSDTVEIKRWQFGLCWNSPVCWDTEQWPFCGSFFHWFFLCLFLWDFFVLGHLLITLLHPYFGISLNYQVPSPPKSKQNKKRRVRRPPMIKEENTRNTYKTYCLKYKKCKQLNIDQLTWP